MTQNLCPRASVGAIIQDGAGHFLVLYRRSFPLGLAFVAGHCEEGEDPKASLKREVLEESGLVVKKCQLVLRRTYRNPCRGGFESHRWLVYDVSAWEGEPHVCEPNKHEFVRFMSPDEIWSYVRRNDADPAWSTFIWPALSQLSRPPL